MCDGIFVKIIFSFTGNTLWSLKRKIPFFAFTCSAIYASRLLWCEFVNLLKIIHKHCCEQFQVGTIFIQWDYIHQSGDPSL